MENRLGPFGMFQHLVHEWSADRTREPGDDGPSLQPREVADKVKRFYH